MRYFLIAAAAIALVGCDFIGDGRAKILETGAEVSDEALVAAENIMCRAASIGSIQRRWMQSAEDWETWNRVCRGNQPLPLPSVTP